jgi:hypothetical protein
MAAAQRQRRIEHPILGLSEADGDHHAMNTIHD